VEWYKKSRKPAAQAQAAETFSILHIMETGAAAAIQDFLEISIIFHLFSR
jgi:hypothetical protein